MFIIILNVLLFFIYSFGLGYSFTRKIKQNTLETAAIRVGIGLGSIPVIGVILSLLNILIDWRIILTLSLAGPLFDFIRSIRTRSSWNYPDYKLFSDSTLIIFLFLLNIFVYCYGSFSYPWLEDDDPWAHAASAKFVAVEKTLKIASGEFEYLNPYPPGYDLVMGIMHQTNTSIYWTLKFFNALIVSLSIVLFYYFSKEFLINRTHAILSTLFLSLIPCYLSHFIWAHSMIVCLFFPAFYCILKTRNDARYLIPSIIVVSGIFLTQPTQSIKFIILVFLLWIAYLCVYKKIWKGPIIAICLAGLLSLLWWFPVGINISSLKFMRRDGAAIELNSSEKATEFSVGLFSPSGGSATESYTFLDYWIPRRDNYINNPLGLGETLVCLTIWGLLLSFYLLIKGDKDNKFIRFTLLLWLLFTFLGQNSKTFNLPIGLFAFRFWMLFAIPVCMLSGDVVVQLLRLSERRLIKTIIITIITLSVFQTAGLPKLSLNTGIWPWGIPWGSMQELNAYLQLKRNFNPNTKIFSFTQNLFVIGNDMMADYWSDKYKESFTDSFDIDVAELHYRLKNNGFEYIIVGKKVVKAYGLDATNAKLKALTTSSLYKLIYHTWEGAFVYKVL